MISHSITFAFIRINLPLKTAIPAADFIHLLLVMFHWTALILVTYPALSTRSQCNSNSVSHIKYVLTGSVTGREAKISPSGQESYDSNNKLHHETMSARRKSERKDTPLWDSTGQHLTSGSFLTFWLSQCCRNRKIGVGCGTFCADDRYTNYC